MAINNIMAFCYKDDRLKIHLEKYTCGKASMKPELI